VKNKNHELDEIWELSILYQKHRWPIKNIIIFSLKLLSKIYLCCETIKGLQQRDLKIKYLKKQVFFYIV